MDQISLSAESPKYYSSVQLCYTTILGQIESRNSTAIKNLHSKRLLHVRLLHKHNSLLNKPLYLVWCFVFAAIIDI